MKKRILGYYVNKSKYYIPGDDLTHLNYCFLEVSDDGSLILNDNPFEINKLKYECPHLKVGFSISSSNLPSICSNKVKRNKLVLDCISIAKKHNFFDYIDIFWYNSFTSDNGILLTFFIIELKKALRMYPHCKITLSAPIDIGSIDSMKLDIIAKHISSFNLISFDYMDEEEIVKYNSSIWGRRGIDRIVKYYIECGVPSDKIIICCSLIGKEYYGIKGFNKEYRNKKDIEYKYIEKKNMKWDYEVGANFTFDKENNIFITFDNLRSLKEKIKYIESMKLGGISFWGIEGDTKENSMIHSANQLIDDADVSLAFKTN